MSRFIGNVSAYAYAVEKGYTGTEEEFAELMASYATVGQTAVEAAQTATTKASEASQSATTATNKASEATTAAQTAINKSAEAQSNAQTASTKASEATTAATAAQTAKTQTEAAASQALTDIETARTGAISAVQTVGQSQTANATAQAQAAATSATTASTKASEASASATSAGQSATNAAASATSAANAASAAQGVLESIPSDYSQMSADVTQLKANLVNVEEKTFNELFTEGSDLIIAQTIDGCGLLANGRRSANEAYDIDIYSLSSNNISSGDILYLKLSADTAGVYQWQTSGGIPVNYDPTNLVGPTVTQAVDGLVVVPTGALYLSVSRNASRTDNVIANTAKRLDAIEEDVSLALTTERFFGSHLLGENLVDSNKLEAGYYYLKGVKTASAAMTSAWIDVDGISVINASGKKISNSTWSGVEMYYICSYDATKAYIADSMVNTGVKQFTIPTGAKYLTVSYVNTTYSKFTVVAGEKRPVRYVNSFKKTILEPSHYGIWYGKKWAAIGDSLTEYNNRNTKNYIEYISEATGITPVNLGASGTGYRRGIASSPANSFYNRVSTIPSDCDVLTIFGSFNDIGGGQTLGTIDDDISDDTVFGYVNATLDAIYTTIPTINIGIIAPTPWKDNRPWDDTETGSKYVEGLKQICYNRGIPFLDLYHCSNLRPWDATARDEFYSNDVVGGVNAGCHPDTEGHKMIAPKIKAFLDTLLL